MRADPRIDAYIARAAPFAQPILRHLRQLVHAGCPEVEETLKWSSPFVVLRGKILCYMPAFKAHIRFGFWHPGMRKLIAKEGRQIGGSMSQLGRITTLADLPDDQTLLRYIRAAAKLQDSAQPDRTKRPSKPKAPLRVPADLAAVLRQNKKGRGHLQGFQLQPPQGVHRVDHRGEAPGSSRQAPRNHAGMAGPRQAEELEVRELLSRPMYRTIVRLRRTAPKAIAQDAGLLFRPRAANRRAIGNNTIPRLSRAQAGADGAFAAAPRNCVAPTATRS